MVDDADRAQVVEEQERLTGVLRVINRQSIAPLMHNGNRLCLDCYDLIQQDRIEAELNAVRCLTCQTIFEKREKKNG